MTNSPIVEKDLKLQNKSQKGKMTVKKDEVKDDFGTINIKKEKLNCVHRAKCNRLWGGYGVIFGKS